MASWVGLLRSCVSGEFAVPVAVEEVLGQVFGLDFDGEARVPGQAGDGQGAEGGESVGIAGPFLVAGPVVRVPVES